MIINTDDYLTAPQIATETGALLTTVHTWLKYYRHMQCIHVFGRPVILRSEFERFRVEHAELFQVKTT